MKKLKHRCDNCAWKGTDADLILTLVDTPALYERLEPGGEVPSGECPECGALCYLIKSTPPVSKATANYKTLIAASAAVLAEIPEDNHDKYIKRVLRRLDKAYKAAVRTQECEIK